LISNYVVKCFYFNRKKIKLYHPIDTKVSRDIYGEKLISDIYHNLLDCRLGVKSIRLYII